MSGYLYTVDCRKSKNAEWVRCQQTAGTIHEAAQLLGVKLDNIIYRTKHKLNGSTIAEVRGAKEMPMSEGTADAVKEMREKAAKKTKAATPSAEAKKESTVKTSAKKKAVKKATPKSGKRAAAEKPAIKKETFTVPDEFTRSFEGKDHEVKKTKDGWVVDSKEPVSSLREAMIAILKAHKKEVGHRAASYFFANVKKAS